MQAELGKVQRREQLLQLKVKELREELAGSRKEVRHLKKAAKTLEVGGGRGEGRAGARLALLVCGVHLLELVSLGLLCCLPAHADLCPAPLHTGTGAGSAVRPATAP